MNQEDDRRLNSAKLVIKKFARNYQLSAKEKIELNDAYETIKSIQLKCFHNRAVVTGFTSVEEYCSYCGSKWPVDNMANLPVKKKY